MKKILLLTSIACLTSSMTQAQWINSITYSPLNPTTADTITFYVSLSFPSGSCHYRTQGLNQNGIFIDAYALHCLGMLTYICNHTDTFQVGPLPAGNYTFRFRLDAGWLPFPCTPSLPTAIDSVSFSVSAVTGILNVPSASFQVQVVNEKLIVYTDSKNRCQIELYDMAGKRLARQRLNSRLTEIDISRLAQGMYFYSITKNRQLVSHGQFAKP
jgi:hypothetical protein